MQRALVWMFRHMPIGMVYSIMHFWLIWYVIVRPTERNGAYDFHRRRGRNRWQAAFDVYRSFYHFGKVILDRFAVYSGHRFDITVENKEFYYDKVQSKSGFVMLFSHFGNSEMAAYTMNTPDKKMNILAFGGESPVVMANRAKVLSENNIGMIIMNPGEMEHIFAIHEAISRGEVLAVAGDRNMGEKAIVCDFMNGKAPFPAGVFQLCVAIKCPILLTFVVKEKGNNYRIYTEELHVNTALSRNENAKDLAQQFATRLEQMALKYPYEWFNFYKFWRDEEPVTNWIPQRPPFVFIDAIEDVNEAHAVTRLLIKNDCPLVENGVMPLSGLMENAAQTCAVRAGWVQKHQGAEVKKGYIGAVKGMAVNRFPRVGEMLRTEANLIQEVMNISLIECTIRVKDEVIATTTLKLATIDE